MKRSLGVWPGLDVGPYQVQALDQATVSCLEWPVVACQTWESYYVDVIFNDLFLVLLSLFVFIFHAY